MGKSILIKVCLSACHTFYVSLSAISPFMIFCPSVHRLQRPVLVYIKSTFYDFPSFHPSVRQSVTYGCMTQIQIKSCPQGLEFQECQQLEILLFNKRLFDDELSINNRQKASKRMNETETQSTSNPSLHR